ncbi:MAG: 4-hydroxy-tetrahydrodipicolinate reductase [Planctomycetales bacterium]|nr:4-hydroxy-tetrahydrodipicolinate reductase [Planctomycetales bacterium]
MSSSELRLAIHGAAGRMGQRLVALGHADPEIRIAAALDNARHPSLGADAGTIAGVGDIGLTIRSALDVEVDAVIDFSVAEAVDAIVATCAENKIPLVLATTGLSETQKAEVERASGKTPIVWAPSMSLAVNLTMKLAQIAGAALKDHPGGADVEIIERHHRFKEDAPSGTALRFGELIADAMDIRGATHGRQGRPGKRPHDEIGYHAVRVGDNPGEHTIVFGLLGETLELRVAASNRDCYALGALAAAKFIVKQSPGLYGMSDVLGL